jgi:hypothetical protein
MSFLGNLFPLVKLLDDLNIISIRGFQMNIAFQRFLYYKTEMRALGAITIIIFAFVFMFFECHCKHLLGLLYLHANFRQVGKLHRRAVFDDQGFQIKAIKVEVPFFYFDAFLGEMKCLFYQVKVRVGDR